MGQTYLVSGKRVSMRLWENEPRQVSEADRRDYETVGYVLAGRAELMIEMKDILADDDYRVLKSALDRPAELRS